MTAEETSSASERYSRSRERSEAKNQAVRDQLEPLEPGERPTAVTVASIAAAVLAIGNIVAYILADKDSGDEGKLALQTAIIVAILATAAIGMWFVKYWAVLGFQTVLGLQFIIFTLSIMKASNVWQVLLFLGIIIASGVLFWFLIRAMARIQMPEPPDLQSLREQREAAEAAAREKEQSDA